MRGEPRIIAGGNASLARSASSSNNDVQCARRRAQKSTEGGNGRDHWEVGGIPRCVAQAARIRMRALRQLCGSTQRNLFTEGDRPMTTAEHGVTIVRTIAAKAETIYT